MAPHFPTCIDNTILKQLLAGLAGPTSLNPGTQPETLTPFMNPTSTITKMATVTGAGQKQMSQM